MLHRRYIPIQECEISTEENEYLFFIEKDDELKKDGNNEGIDK